MERKESYEAPFVFVYYLKYEGTICISGDLDDYIDGGDFLWEEEVIL